MKMHIGQQRKDGKYPVQFVFPISGKRLSKVMTKDQIDEAIAKAERGGTPYHVTGYALLSKAGPIIGLGVLAAVAAFGSRRGGQGRS